MELLKQKEILQDQVDQMKHDVQRYEKERKDFQVIREQLRQEVVMLTNMLSEANQRRQSLTKTSSHLQNESLVEEMELQKRYYEEEIETLTAKIENSQKNATDLSMQCGVKESALDTLRQALCDSQRDLLLLHESKERAIKELQEEIDRLTKKNADFELVVQHLHDQTGKLKMELEDQQQTLIEKEKAYILLQNARDQEISVFKQELDHLYKTVNIEDAKHYRL
jgi:predicted  nucleic acid-binding Zn-ribbon protein